MLKKEQFIYQKTFHVNPSVGLLISINIIYPVIFRSLNQSNTDSHLSQINIDCEPVWIEDSPNSK